LCEQQNLRGRVVQQGGAKALIPLALEGTRLVKITKKRHQKLIILSLSMTNRN
jgi:hypothetical protein